MSLEWTQSAKAGVGVENYVPMEAVFKAVCARSVRGVLGKRAYSCALTVLLLAAMSVCAVCGFPSAAYAASCYGAPEEGPPADRPDELIEQGGFGCEFEQGDDAPCSLIAVLESNTLFIRVADGADDDSGSGAGNDDSPEGDGDEPLANDEGAGGEGAAQDPPSQQDDEAPNPGAPDPKQRQDDELGNGPDAQAEYYVLGDGSVAEEGSMPWRERREAIRHVSIGDGVRPKSMAWWFSDLCKLESISFGGLDTSYVSDMSRLFSDCSSLASLDLSGFNTERVTGMSKMFAGCSSIASLDLTAFDTSKVTSMEGMFSGASALKAVDVSSFNTANVANMDAMFSGCSAVASLDLSSFTTEKLESLEGMFAGCTSLAALDVSGFTADQLEAASVPLDNEGGFWLLNAPADFTYGISLRAPLEGEREAAGYPAEKPSSTETKPASNQPTDGGSASGGASSSDNAPAETPSAAPVSTTTETTLPVTAAASATPGSETAHKADTASAGAEAASVTRSILAPLPQGAAGFFPAAGALAASEESGGDVGSAIQESRGEAEEGASSGAVLSVSALVKSLQEAGSAISTAIASVRDSLVDSSAALETASSVLEAFSISSVVDKSLAMAVAALGMLVSAVLVLALCLKIRYPCRRPRGRHAAGSAEGASAILQAPPS